MGIKEALQNMRERKEKKKELFRQLQEQDIMQKILEERKKSSNQRELERYMKEDEEKSIKETLEEMRKRRQKDISFNHNPLNTKNITNNVSWEVLKEKNMFKKNKNMFINQPYIHKSNNNLLKNRKKGRSMFKC